MKRLLLFFLLGIVVLTSCNAKEQVKASQLNVYVVSDNEAFEADNADEEKLNVFEVSSEGTKEWYYDTAERRQMLREFRNEFEQEKEDFEAEKRSQYKNVRAVIDGEMIIGYEEAVDLDKSYVQSLTEPNAKSNSVYATQSGKGGGDR